jgi:hypothetical protein
MDLCCRSKSALPVLASTEEDMALAGTDCLRHHTFEEPFTREPKAAECVQCHGELPIGEVETHILTYCSGAQYKCHQYKRMFEGLTHLTIHMARQMPKQTMLV